VTDWLKTSQGVPLTSRDLEDSTLKNSVAAAIIRSFSTRDRRWRFCTEVIALTCVFVIVLVLILALALLWQNKLEGMDGRNQILAKCFSTFTIALTISIASRSR
jgi:hypothetical protein